MIYERFTIPVLPRLKVSINTRYLWTELDWVWKMAPCSTLWPKAEASHSGSRPLWQPCRQSNALRAKVNSSLWQVIRKVKPGTVATCAPLSRAVRDNMWPTTTNKYTSRASGRIRTSQRNSTDVGKNCNNGSAKRTRSVSIVPKLCHRLYHWHKHAFFVSAAQLVNSEAIVHCTYSGHITSRGRHGWGYI